jgi:hypothetical protein
MNRPVVVIAVLALGAILTSAQDSRKAEETSPRELVDQVWRLATQGELLSPEGWDRVARGYFRDPAPSPGDKVVLLRPRGDNIILVVSNDWGIVDSTIQGKTAKVVVEYYDAGRIDSTLGYTSGKEPPPIGKTEALFTLVLAPTHHIINYKPFGDALTYGDVKAGPPAWQIEDPQGPPWTTVNTAIRYVLERRNKTTDPAVRKNADETLAKLLKFHGSP